MKADKPHPLQNNFPVQQMPPRVFEEKGPREDSKNERPEAGRDQGMLFYDKPIYKAKKYLLF